MTDAKAYTAGSRAFAEGNAEFENPHIEGTYLFWCWRVGFQDAELIQRRREGHPV